MRNKAMLPLIEMAVMVLVFALAAVICLKMFVYAERVSNESNQKSSMITDAVSVAETLKGCNGDLEEASLILGGEVDENTWTYGSVSALIDENTEKDNLLVDKAIISAKDKKGTTLFSFEISWQTPSKKSGANHD